VAPPCQRALVMREPVYNHTVRIMFVVTDGFRPELMCHVIKSFKF